MLNNENGWQRQLIVTNVDAFEQASAKEKTGVLVNSCEILVV